MLNNKKGILSICYGKISDVEKSGFDFIKIGFNASLCIGYPQMHAFLSEYDGSGYRMHFCWIQIITDNIIRNDANRSKESFVEVDLSPKNRLTYQKHQGNRLG